jgi:hypothetical protein
MQGIYKQIYEMALEEVDRPPFNFHTEQVIIHKGFRVSKTIDGVYDWKDVRFDDYYEEVDPLITEKVLELGFVNALTLVMIHNDADKLIELNRRVINIDKEIEYWVNKSTEIYNNRKKAISTINRSETLSKETKRRRLTSADKKYDRDRRLFEKKRRILKEEKDDVKVDQIFYNNRIKSFNN